MAYYNSDYYYNDDQTHSGESYDQTSDNFSNNFVPQNTPEPSIYNLFDYNIPTHYYYNHAYNTQSHSPSFSLSSHSITTAYSTFTPTDPKSLQHYYDPNCHQLTVTTHYNQIAPQTTQSLKSNVNKEALNFNAPEFEEYDPTPYGGGYDIVQTYGRPLPPSNQTCFPPDGGDSIKSPPQKKKVTFSDDLDAAKEKKKKEESKPKEDLEAPTKKPNEVTGPVIENCNDLIMANRLIPSGYGLEAMDLCESLFGFWPCQSRYYAQRRSDFLCGGEGGAVEYFFGSCDPYVERRDGGGSFGLPIHCYDRRFQEQALSVCVEFDDQCDYRLDQGDGDGDDDDNSW